MIACRFASLLVFGAAILILSCCATGVPTTYEKHKSAPAARLPPPPPSPPQQQQQQQQQQIARPTGRGWLVANESEPAGYGLYSYLLFGSRPSEATRPVYVAIVNASLGKVEPIERQLQAGYAPPQVNLYLIPLYSQPPMDLKPGDLANWMVDNYNYARASRILGAVPSGGTGIYIVSVLAKPIDPSQQIHPPYLWQNLSHVAPAIAPAWIQHFMNQAAKEAPWDENMAEKLALDLRNEIEQVAGEVNITLPAMATAIKWFKPGS